MYNVIADGIRVFECFDELPDDAKVVIITHEKEIDLLDCKNELESLGYAVDIVDDGYDFARISKKLTDADYKTIIMDLILAAQDLQGCLLNWMEIADVDDRRQYDEDSVGRLDRILQETRIKDEDWDED